MISFLWYGRKIIISGIIYVMRIYAYYIFFLLAGRWPGRNKDWTYKI